MPRLRRFRSPSLSRSYGFIVLDDSPPDLRDAYHALLHLSWPKALSLIVGAWLLLNALFAGLYMASGGIAHAEPGSFLDAFYFSVQTMGTIGYGDMHPSTRLANGIVVLQSVVGLLATAVATGIVFVRFSHVTGRMRFSKAVAISLMDGVPHLTLRLGNGRDNRIFDAQMRLTWVHTVRTKEGMTIYRNEDLSLVKAWAPNLTRSWNLLHRIDEASPLFGQTPESLAASETEIHVAVTGTDETTLQPVHGRCVWDAKDIVFGARLADVLSETPEGDMLLDMRRFDDLEATEPTEAFPYPKPEGAGATSS